MAGRFRRYVGSRAFRYGAICTAVALFFIGPLLLTITPSVSAEDFTFGSENVTAGHSSGSANRDVEDATYQTLTEEDQYTNTNFSASNENVVTGTGGGGAFPDALNTDDATRRSYTEENTAGAAPEPYSIFIWPTGDSSVNWDDVFPVSPSTHYDKVDDHPYDSGTTYVATSSNGDADYFTMSDISEPESGYDINVTVFAVHQKDASQPCNFQAGIYVGSTDYIAISLNPTNGVWTNDSGTTWTENPDTSAEWTYSEVNALLTVITTNDASPSVYCTQVGLRIDVWFSGGSTNYELDAQITYSSVTSTAQTTGYMVFCQGYRTDASEDFGVFAFDYVGEDWHLKDTIDQTSDTDFDFQLTTDERDGTGNEVKLRIQGLTETGDSTQNVVYFDVLKVSRIEQGYKLDVDMTASSLNEYGNLRLKVKGYTSSEEFNVNIWNYSSSAYDTDKISVTALSNTLYTYDLIMEHHRSSSETVKIQFTDETAYTSDTTADVLYLDWVVLTWMHQDPTITLYHDNGPVNLGSSAQFWLNYTDGDDEAPTYVRVVIDSTPYDMSKNETDTTYWDGVNYSFSKSDLTGGAHPYYFAVKDANSGEVTTGEDSITINRAPTLTLDGVVPPTGNPGTYSFYVTFTDLDGDLPDYIKAVIDATPYDMLENDSEDTDTTDGKGYYYEKVMAGGSHTYKFITADYLSAEVSTTQKNLNVNNLPVLSSFTREPSDPCYPTTLVWFNCTFTDLDNEMPSSIKWRESEGAVQNITMTQTDPGDTTTSDGKDYYCSVYLSHGSHDYDFYASDGTGSTSGGDDSITIQNRDPIITNEPSTTTTYRSTYWEWDVDATDPDEDTVSFEEWDNCTFALTINGASGLLSGTTDTNLGWYEVTVWANDSYGGSDSYHFHLTVANRAPVITSAGNTTQPLDTFMCYHVTYTDDDGDSVEVELWSNATFLSEENDYVNGTATPVGWYECTVWANDSYGGSDMEHWHLTVTSEPENDPPYFTSTPITSVQNNTFYSYDANATDPTEPPDTLTYGLEGNCTTYLSIHSSLGYVNGTILYVGWYYVNISVTDGTSTVWQNFTLTAQNSPPTITTTPSTTGNVGVTYEYDADADDLNSDTLYWDTTEKPAWLVLDHATGEMTGNPTLEGDYDVNLTCEDSEGGMDWQNWTISVGEEPPEEPPDGGSSGGGHSLGARFTYYSHGYTLYVFDESTSPEIVRYRWDFGDGYGSNLPDTHHTYAKVGTYRVSLTVYDSGGHSQTVTAQVEITLDPDDWLHKTSIGWEVSIAGTSFALPAWLLGVLGALLILSTKYRKGKYVKVRWIAGTCLVLIMLAFYWW